MSSAGWLEVGSPHVWRPYCQHATAGAPLAVVGASGCRLLLEDGRELVDGTASWWTAAHGYGHPHIRARVSEQLRVLPHVAFGGLAHEAGYTLAKRLCDTVSGGSGTAAGGPLSHVFFTESGSVAVEVALKMAIQSFYNAGHPRKTVVAFDGAYHGDTFAAMSLCDPVDGMHSAFSGTGLRVIHMPVPVTGDERAFETALGVIADDVACVIIEPILQCAGGMRIHDAEVLGRLRRACDAHGAWLIFDEIATGFYRTGTRFAFDQAELLPDVLVLGKALTGGTLPMAAAITNDRVFGAFFGSRTEASLAHGPTYMANALSCAAAHASLDLFEQGDYLARVRRLEAAMQAGLSGFRWRRHVVDVRVKGAMGVLEMQQGTAPSSDVFAGAGAFIRPIRMRGADLVALMPPLVIEEADLNVLFGAIDGAIP